MTARVAPEKTDYARATRVLLKHFDHKNEVTRQRPDRIGPKGTDESSRNGTDRTEDPSENGPGQRPVSRQRQGRGTVRDRTEDSSATRPNRTEDPSQAGPIRTGPDRGPTRDRTVGSSETAPGQRPVHRTEDSSETGPDQNRPGRGPAIGHTRSRACQKPDWTGPRTRQRPGRTGSRTRQRPDRKPDIHKTGPRVRQRMDRAPIRDRIDDPSKTDLDRIRCQNGPDQGPVQVRIGSDRTGLDRTRDSSEHVSPLSPAASPRGSVGNLQALKLLLPSFRCTWPVPLDTLRATLAAVDPKYLLIGPAPGRPRGVRGTPGAQGPGRCFYPI